MGLLVDCLGGRGCIDRDDLSNVARDSECSAGGFSFWEEIQFMFGFGLWSSVLRRC